VQGGVWLGSSLPVGPGYTKNRSKAKLDEVKIN
jgi:hypothetical protein